MTYPIARRTLGCDRTAECSTSVLVVVRFVLITMCALYHTLVPKADAALTAIELQQNVLNERNRVTSGHVVLDSVYWENGATIINKWIVKFDGDKRLVENVKEYPHSRPEKQRGTYVEVNCFGCFGGDMEVFHTDEVLNDGRTFALRISDPGAQDPTLTYIPDPRWIGLLPVNLYLMRHFSMQSVIGSKSAASAELSDDMLATTECKRISYNTSPDELYQAWIVPSEGYSVRKLVHSFTTSGTFYKDTVECEYARVDKDVKWFPSKCHFSRQEGKEGAKDSLKTSMKEDLTVSVVSINEPFAEETFSLKGIRTLKPNTMLAWVSKRQPPAPGDVRWDGNGFVSFSPAPMAANSDERLLANARSKSFWIYINLGVIFAVIAAILLRNRMPV